MKKLLFFSELGRLLKSRLTWLVMLLALVSPMAGLVWYKPASAETMLSMYLANPALAGGVAGGILFGLLTLYELDRTGRSRVDVLVDAAVSPLTMAFLRILSLLAVSVLTLALTMLVWLPICRGLIGAVFDMGDYVPAWLFVHGACSSAGNTGRIFRLAVYGAGGSVPGAVCRLCRAQSDRLGGQLAALLAQSLRVGAVG